MCLLTLCYWVLAVHSVAVYIFGAHIVPHKLAPGGACLICAVSYCLLRNRHYLILQHKFL